MYSGNMTGIGKLLCAIGLVLALLFAQYYLRRFLKMRKWEEGTPLTQK